MARVGMPELLIILLLLFGATKLPELARGLGQAMREDKRALREGVSEDEAPAVAPASVNSQPQTRRRSV